MSMCGIKKKRGRKDITIHPQRREQEGKSRTQSPVIKQREGKGAGCTYFTGIFAWGGFFAWGGIGSFAWVAS